MNTRASDASGNSVGRSTLMLQKTACRLSIPSAAALRFTSATSGSRISSPRK